MIAMAALAIAGCGKLSDTSGAVRTAGRNPTLLDWPARGDLVRDTRILEQGVCCTGPNNSGPHDRAILFAGHVPGGAVVITQALAHGTATGRFADAGQFPLRRDGTPEAGSGTDISLSQHPHGISALLQVPDPASGVGSVATLSHENPFLFVVPAPGVDGFAYRLTESSAWIPVDLRAGWATVGVPAGTDGLALTVRWQVGNRVVEQGSSSTPYPAFA